MTDQVSLCRAQPSGCCGMGHTCQRPCAVQDRAHLHWPYATAHHLMLHASCIPRPARSTTLCQSVLSPHAMLPSACRYHSIALTRCLNANAAVKTSIDKHCLSCGQLQLFERRPSRACTTKSTSSAAGAGAIVLLRPVSSCWDLSALLR